MSKHKIIAIALLVTITMALPPIATAQLDRLRDAVDDVRGVVESDDPTGLRDRLHTQFGVDARVIGPAVQVSHPDAPSLVASLYDALGDDIHSTTVRRPTLEDVFMVHAGVSSDLESETVFGRESS